MISNESICERLLATNEVEHVEVDGDGYHYHVVVVSDAFVGMPRVKRQQWVYGKLNDWITQGELHALNMKTWTKAEWETQNG